VVRTVSRSHPLSRRRRVPRPILSSVALPLDRIPAPVLDRHNLRWRVYDRLGVREGSSSLATPTDS